MTTPSTPSSGPELPSGIESYLKREDPWHPEGKARMDKIAEQIAKKAADATKADENWGKEV